MQAQSAQALVRPTISGALRAVEALLMRGGQQTARRNAWTAVLEDRKRAKDRNEAQHVLESLTGTPLAAARNAGAAEA